LDIGVLWRRRPATRAFSQRIGACLAWQAERSGLSPSHLTLCSLFTSLAAALLYATLPPGWLAILLCMALYQFSYGFDCADGQLARATRKTSEFGAWIDISVDTVTMLTFSFAAIFWLSSQSVSGPGTYFCFTILTIGRILVLYASKNVLNSTHARSNRPFALSNLPKQVVWFLVDTPVFITFACAFRDTPVALQIYALMIGSTQIAQAIYLGMRLQRA